MSTVRIDITELDSGTVKGTDEYPAVDVTDSSQADSGTTKKYEIADLLNFIVNSLGFAVYPNVVAASTVNLNATYDNGVSGVNATLTNAGALAAFTLDGETGVENYYYLIKDQTSTANNGIYKLTEVGSASLEWELTRATYFNSSSNILDGKLVFVVNGTTQSDTMWETDVTEPVTVGTGSILFNAFSIPSVVPSPYLTWVVVGGTSESMLVNYGYIPTNVALTTLTLPTTAEPGDTFKIMGYGSGGWKIAQNAGQKIFFGNQATTLGAGGYIASTNRYDAIELICIDDDNFMSVSSSIGNITVV